MGFAWFTRTTYLGFDPDNTEETNEVPFRSDPTATPDQGTDYDDLAEC